MRFINCCIYILSFFVFLSYANADVISDDVSNIVNEDSQESLPYEENARLNSKIEDLDTKNKELQLEIEHLNQNLESKVKAKEAEQAVLEQAKVLFDEIQQPLYSETEHENLNTDEYKNAMVGIELGNLTYAKEQLKLVINQAPATDTREQLSTIQSKANLILGKIALIDKDLNSALSYFSASYTTANTADTSILSLYNLMIVFYTLDKPVESCKIYESLMEAIKSAKEQKFTYNTKLIHIGVYESVKGRYLCGMPQVQQDKIEDSKDSSPEHTSENITTEAKASDEPVIVKRGEATKQ